MEDFIHLHVHTQYSILDGQSKIPHLVDKAIKDGMKGMAVTDHGVMFGIKELTDYCGKVNKGRKKEGLEPFKPTRLPVRRRADSHSPSVPRQMTPVSSRDFLVVSLSRSRSNSLPLKGGPRRLIWRIAPPWALF